MSPESINPISVGSVRLRGPQARTAAERTDQPCYVRYISDNPFRLLGISSTTVHKELRSRSKQSALKAQVGLAPAVPLSEFFGSEELPRCPDIVHATANDPVERTVYRLFWPFHYDDHSGFDGILIGSGNQLRGPTDELSAMQIEFLRCWYGFQIHADLTSLTQCFDEFTELSNCTQCDDFLADILASEGEKLPPTIVDDAKKKSMRYLLEHACHRVVQRFETGDSEKATEMVNCIISAPFEDDMIDQVLTATIEPAGDREAARLKQLMEDFEEWLPGTDARPLIAETEKLREFSSALEGRVPASSRWLEVVDERISHVVYSMRGFAIDLANEELDYDGASNVLAQAHSLPIPLTLQQQIEEDMAALREVQELHQPEDAVYEVVTTGSSVHIPPMCICCSRVADDEHRVSRGWTECSSPYSRRAISLGLPICTACKKHGEELGNKGFFLVVAACLISTGLTYLMGLALPGLNVSWFIAFGLLFGVVSAVMFSRIIRLKWLDEQHATRGEAAWIADSYGDTVHLRFRHSGYARAFAKANGTTAREISSARNGRCTSLLRGLTTAKLAFWLATLCVVMSLIMYAGFTGDVGRALDAATSQPTQTENSAPGTESPPADTSSADDYTTGDSAESDSARQERLVAERDALQSKLEAAQVSVEASGSQIDALHQDLNARSEEIEQGRLYVDHYSSQSVSDFNAKVRRFNRDKGRFNSMVRQHNKRLRAAQRDLERLNQINQALQEMGG